MNLTTTRPTTKSSVGGEIDFLWLEMTNRCNLECTHCYAGSSPTANDTSLSTNEYANLLRESRSLGCRRVQFIGGEPTLNRSLPQLIKLADSLGFELIEVYTNLVSLPDKLLRCFEKHKVQVATSIYFNSPSVHDLITTRKGSWQRTMDNVERLLKEGISLRASVIEMEENRGSVEEVRDWLRSKGILEVGIDRLRSFGRGSSGEAQMSELCGNCASGTLCVGPDGVVAPCIMSKDWAVGSVRESSLSSIVDSDLLRATRASILSETSETSEGREYSMGGCQPDSKNPCGPDCGPNNACNPCSPKGHCGPNSCQPNR